MVASARASGGATCRSSPVSRSVHHSGLAGTILRPLLPLPRLNGLCCCPTLRARRCCATPKRRVFTFNTDTTGLDVATTDVLSVAILDVESGKDYRMLVNPRLADPAAPITTDATLFHGV